MRSPGVTYRQFRLLKHNRLKKELEENLSRVPKNCSSWKEISLVDDKGKPYKVPLCFFRQPKKGPLNIDELLICATAENARQCNAFTPKYSKEDIEKEFNKDILNPKIANSKYPELSAFLWIMDRDLYEAEKKPGVLTTLIVRSIQALESLLKKLNKWKDTKVKEEDL